MSNTDEFLNRYRLLEDAIEHEYDLQPGTSAINYILHRSEFGDVRDELDFCREVRNLLTHNPKIDGSYAVEPSGEMLTLLDRVKERISNPVRARNIYAPMSKILWRKPEDSVLETLKLMHTNIYSRVPILSAGRVVGVFSKSTVLSYIIDRGSVMMEKELTFKDIMDYLPPEKHHDETYRFIPDDMPVSRIRELFGQALKHSDKIGMLFVTKNGKPGEKLLGILTAWDVAAK